MSIFHFLSGNKHKEKFENDFVVLICIQKIPIVHEGLTHPYEFLFPF